MTKSCLNCISHGPPVSLTVPKSRPCKDCIPYQGSPKWQQTDKEIKEEE